VLDVGKDVDQATLASVFQDVKGFRKDEQDCIETVQNLYICLPNRTNSTFLH
jgi:hypothetical protein